MAGMDADDRAFMRELLRRHEKATDAMIAGFDAMIKRFDAGTELLKEQTREAREHGSRCGRTTASSSRR